MKGVFVTATGTEVGKTVVSCALARSLKDRGLDVGVMKPVASGCRRKGGRLVSEDALLLKRAADSRDDLDLINPVRFRLPLAPASAARFEKKKFSLQAVMSAWRELARRHDFVVVEGIGGVRVPLDGKTEVVDLIAGMGLPAIVVASAGLGTLNHTLLTLDYLRRRKIKTLGVILNFFESGKIEDQTNQAFFKARHIPILAALPRTRHRFRASALRVALSAIAPWASPRSN